MQNDDLLTNLCLKYVIWFNEWALGYVFRLLLTRIIFNSDMHK